MAEKTANTKQPEKSRQTEKPKQVQKVARTADKDREKPKQPNAIGRWYRETLGELRKVTWPATQDAWRLTRIVLLVMFVMSALLGMLDFVFSRFISLLVS